MPVPNYGVLKGSVVAFKPERTGKSPHFEIHVRGAGTDFRVAVNVKSSDAKAELLFLLADPFQHPITDRLRGLAGGFHRLQDRSGLDYVRGNLFDRQRNHDFFYKSI